MKYDTVMINVVDDRYSVVFLSDDSEREETETTPNDEGYYHYPRIMSPELALNKLKKHMIDNISKDIKHLQEKIEKMNKLQTPSIRICR